MSFGRRTREELRSPRRTRYRPYETLDRPQMRRNPVKALCSFTYDDKDIFIEREEEHPLGDTTCRDLTFEEVPPPARPTVNSLQECSDGGVIDMATAGKLLYDMKTKGQFSEGSYQEFLRNVATKHITKFSYENLDEFDGESYRGVLAQGAQLQGDILLSKMEILQRKALMSVQDPVKESPSQSTFSVTNCTRTWILDAEKPFIKISLVDSSLSWVRRRGETNFVQSLSLFRYILKRITDPPAKIKEYAVRLNRGNGRNGTLRNLPEGVEHTLLDFAEDMLGYGREELKPGFHFDKPKSSFYMGLGKNEEERDSVLERLIGERSVWRKQLLKALQRALSDVRCRPYLV